MASSLPPGVSQQDIPGNRPEDALYEHTVDHLPKYIVDETEREQKGDVSSPSHRANDAKDIHRRRLVEEDYN